MKTVPLQLITVGLENGQTGVFVGVPLVTEETSDSGCQVEDIWFSNVQEIPDNLSVAKLLRMVAEQLCRLQSNVH